MRRLAAVMLMVALAGARAQATSLESSELTAARNVRGTFLSRAVGARPAGMGDAYVAMADDASAGSWNPAGLGQLTRFGFVATYDHVSQDTGLRYLAAGMPAGPGVAGVTLTSMSYGSYDVFDSLGTRTGIKALSDIGASAAYAVENPDWSGGFGWSGISVEVAREAVGTTLIGAGAGTLILLGERLSLGAAVQHLGPRQGGYALPGAARLGAAWMPRDTIRLIGEVADSLATKTVWAAGGCEAVFGQRLAFRAGYRVAVNGRAGPGVSGFTTGLGFKISGFGIDYAYQPFGALATSHRVALVYGAASGQAAMP